MKDSQSLVLARESMHAQTGLIVAPRDGLSLCLLLVDSSGSMQGHGDTPRLSANELLRTIRDARGAERSLFGLWTFNDEAHLEIPPMLATRVPELERFQAEGRTALFLAVHEALALGLEFSGYVRHQFQAETQVGIVVISDGANTVEPQWLQPCRKLAEIARQMPGFKLETIGLGIDSDQLARRLGFDPQLAHDEDATEAGLHRTMTRASCSFVGTMNSGRRSTPTPPSDS